MAKLDRATVQRIYGRGLIEGLVMAGIENPGEFMSSTRLAAAEKHLSGIAKKVLHAVPIAEAWPAVKIGQEMKRNGSSPEIKVIQGCLDSLKSSGLVREPKDGHFIRIVPKQKPTPESEAMQKNQKPQTTGNAPAATPAEKSAPIDRLSALAAQARTMGNQLIQWAEDIEETALMVEEQVQENQADSERLKQLRAVLKGI